MRCPLRSHGRCFSLPIWRCGGRGQRQRAKSRATAGSADREPSRTNLPRHYPRRLIVPSADRTFGGHLAWSLPKYCLSLQAFDLHSVLARRRVRRTKTQRFSMIGAIACNECTLDNPPIAGRRTFCGPQQSNEGGGGAQQYNGPSRRELAYTDRGSPRRTTKSRGDNRLA